MRHIAYYYKGWARWRLSSLLIFNIIVLCIALGIFLLIKYRRCAVVKEGNQMVIKVEDKWISFSKGTPTYLIKLSFSFNDQANTRVVGCKKVEWENATLNKHYLAYYILNRDSSKVVRLVPIINNVD